MTRQLTSQPSGSSLQKASRRLFLGQNAAIIAGGIGTPYIVSSSTLAAPNKPGANDRIGIGYIGMGRRAAQLMNLPKEAQIVAIADINIDRAKSVATRVGCKAYQDYRELLESKDVDAVVVATPDHWHTLASIHACQAGKDVYCEKPLTLTIREGRLLVNAVRKYQRVLQTGSQQRSMPLNRLGCELIRNGRIGKVHTIIGHNYASPWECALPSQKTPHQIDWDMWCGPTSVRPFHQDLYLPRANPGWISFRPYSGGEMTGWGAHGLDQVQWALGMDNSGPTEIWTEGEPFKPPVYSQPASRKNGDTICSQPAVFFRYANGAVLKLIDGPPGGAVFIGDRGTITIGRSSLTAEPESLLKEPFADSDIRLSVSNHHMQNWIDCIKSRQKPIADVEIGHRSATVCHLGNIARWTGRKLQWNPEKEIFIGDAQANLLLERPGRKPFQLPDTV